MSKTAHRSQRDQLRATFRIIKGAPLTILLAMLNLDGDIGVMELCEITTYSDKTVKRALEALADAGLVTRTHYFSGLKLTRHGSQLPLILSTRQFGESPKSHGQIGEIPLLNTSNDVLQEGDDQDHQDSEYVSKPANRRKSELLDLYRSWGIHGRKLDVLAASDRLSPYQAEVIHAKFKRRVGVSNEAFNVGLLITMLERDPVPDHEPGSEDARKRYVEGEFSDFIEH